MRRGDLTCAVFISGSLVGSLGLSRVLTWELSAKPVTQRRVP